MVRTQTPLGQPSRKWRARHGTLTPQRSVTHKDKREPPGSPSCAGHAYDSYGLDTIHPKMPSALINPSYRSLSKASDKKQVREPSPASL